MKELFCKTVLATHLSYTLKKKRWATMVLFVIVITELWCMKLGFCAT